VRAASTPVRALVLHVLLADLDELGEFVVPLHEQHIDVRPGELDCGADAHQAVVDPDQIAEQGDEQEDQD
jgi:hypothetical protein